MKKEIRIIFFLIGFCLCLYPVVSSLMEQQRQKSAIATFEQEVEHADEEKIDTCIRQAQEYNQILFQSGGWIITDSEKILSEESYQSRLNLFGNGIMGSLEIPKISVNIPIYHGTGQDVLSAGVGHLYGSSLPVGGTNTHSVLTGHRGLPNSKLFTRLDEMEKGDLFFVRICNQQLAYVVSEIHVIRPQEKEALAIREGQDLVSLVTCTPYGINTHRLVVIGKRVSQKEVEGLEVKPQIMSFRELVFASLPFLFLIIAIIGLIKRKERKNYEKEN